MLTVKSERGGAYGNFLDDRRLRARGRNKRGGEAVMPPIFEITSTHNNTPIFCIRKSRLFVEVGFSLFLKKNLKKFEKSVKKRLTFILSARIIVHG